ncbi:hypothetical protein M569_14982 [Genlisea aurea]|uniref:TFIIS N-terminal domain-containing protein n=1 Tax=Genlisea aurea TaxID=192259 RepID=S8DK15_9LAMI|nr:hypothetical protein M569_14982 [Genlisea aurea]
MAKDFNSLNTWRAYFRTANSDIFDIIEHAVMVAASDCPYEFKSRRDRIAELLFSCKSIKCSGCDKLQLGLPRSAVSTRSEEEKCKSVIETGGTNKDDDDDQMVKYAANQISNYSYGEAEALTDELEEELQLHGEVLRIKQLLDDYQEQPDSLLCDSLRRLQLMPLNVEILKSTEIGKTVNAIRKHGSKEIRSLARTLIEDWKVMVDAWVDTTATIAAEVATESVKTSTVEYEDGLPSPPMDEAAFFATPTSMELSQFFDGMDDDGKSNEINNPKKAAAKAAPPVNNNPRKPEVSSRQFAPPPPSLKSSKPQKPTPRIEVRKNDETTTSVGEKLETAKRKLHERYQEAENAKRQRTIQVVELCDLPKQKQSGGGVRRNNNSNNQGGGIRRKQQWIKR